MSLLIEKQAPSTCRFCLELIEANEGITIDRILKEKFEELTQLKVFPDSCLSIEPFSSQFL